MWRITPDTAQGDHAATAIAFMRAVTEATAGMIADWMASGFVHGVMNTDNMVVTGESFDYGPWRFLPAAEPGFTAAYFDHTGLYSFGRQPERGLWNLVQLAGCLALIADTDALENVLKEYPKFYQRALRDKIFARLGLAQGDLAKDIELVSSLLAWMTQAEADFEQVFFDWFGGAASVDRAKVSPQAALYDDADFEPVRAAIVGRESVAGERLSHAYFQAARPVTLLIDEVEALWAPIAEKDDWSMFEAKLAAIETARQAYGFKPVMWRHPEDAD